VSVATRVTRGNCSDGNQGSASSRHRNTTGISRIEFGASPVRANGGGIGQSRALLLSLRSVGPHEDLTSESASQLFSLRIKRNGGQLVPID